MKIRIHAALAVKGLTYNVRLMLGKSAMWPNINPFRAGTDFRRQILTSKSIPALKELNNLKRP